MRGWARERGPEPCCPCMWFHPYPGTHRASPCLRGLRVVPLCVSVGWACHNVQPQPSSSSPLCTPISSLSPCITPTFAFCPLQGCSGSSGQHQSCWLVCSELPEQDWTLFCAQCGAAACTQGCATSQLLKHVVTCRSSPCSKISRSILQVSNLRKTNKCRAAWLYLSET